MTQKDPKVTTDRQTIREWADRNDYVPVYDSARDGYDYRLMRRDRVGAGQEQRGWDEFFQAAKADDKVVVYRDQEAGGGTDRYELVDRDEAAERATLADEDVKEALARGDTVTTEITESKVVETEVVETDTIESEVIDRDLGGRTMIDRELQNRDVVKSKFLDDETVELEVDETWLRTSEITQRLLVESRIADIDLEGRQDPESDSVQTSVDVEGVERTILESDLVGPQTTDIADDTALVRSEVVDERTIHSQLFEDQIIEELVRERKRLRFRLSESETLESEVDDRTVMESEIVERDFDDQPGTETPPAEASGGARAEPATAGEQRGVEFSESDRGKDVVDQTNEEIGMVSEVEGDRLFVDTDPSVTDKLKARLGWGDVSEDTYPLDQSQVQEITDDRVVVSH